MYCVTKNGAARCAGHDTAIRLELRFFSRRCRDESWRRGGPQRRYFGSRRYPKTGLLASIRRILCDRSTDALVVSNGAYAATLARVYAQRKPGLPGELS